MIEYVSCEQVVAIHRALLERFGGGDGLRDAGGLEAAVARPAMTFGGDDLYPDLGSKAAALMHSLVLNHPFVDGNKRVGAAAAELLVVLNNHTLSASDDDIVRMTLATAEGRISVEALTVWFRQRLCSQQP